MTADVEMTERCEVRDDRDHARRCGLIAGHQCPHASRSKTGLTIWNVKGATGALPPMGDDDWLAWPWMNQ
jgi:hypothetical protein